MRQSLFENCVSVTRNLSAVLLLSFSVLLASQTAAAEEDLNDLGDPLRDINILVFQFNEALDKVLAKPVAQAYKGVVPKRMQWGVENFFSNIGELQNVLNGLMQGKFYQVANDSGRFLINSSVGMVGLFDVATRMGLRESDGEDFGQTLATWGVPQGPYLVLPLMGPSTLRELPARLVDSLVGLSEHVDDVAARNTLLGLDLVDMRARLLDAEASLSGDRYTLLKEIYLQRREFLINDGVVEDDFGDFGEYDDY